MQVDKIEQCKGKYKRSDEDAFKEGCRIQGHLEVNRVSAARSSVRLLIHLFSLLQMAGSFHFAPGKSFSIRQFHIHDFQFTNVKLSHTINHLSFGEKIEFAKTHPLDGLRVDVEGKYKGRGWVLVSFFA